MKPKISIIKIGGQLIEAPQQLQQLLKTFSQLEGAKLLVHGGGRRASELAKKLDIPVRFHEGRRITDQATLELAVMVYAGLINKGLVSQLQAKSCPALGLCGADGNLIQARKRRAGAIDYGFAGDIEQINVDFLQQVLAQGLTPVVCAITHDDQGQLLNTNADTIAAQLAIALTKHYEVSLKFCFEKNGVYHQLEVEDSLIEELNYQNYLQLRSEGIFKAGMLPKLEQAFAALRGQVSEVAICGVGALAQTSTIKRTSLCL
ncbi:MAG: acetylglutamate kinase [Bacteroidota bacterium]